MAVHLLNSAVMPRAGVYTLRSLSAKEFARRVRSYHGLGVLQSYIGYPAYVAMLEELCGIKVALNRASTQVNDGDLLLICRLAYRVDNPALKGQTEATVADYEFFTANYQEGLERTATLTRRTDLVRSLLKEALHI